MKRISKAMKEPIYLLHSKEKDGHWEFEVQGKIKKTYIVTISPNGSKCTCPDHTYRKSVCKHIYFIIGRVGRDRQGLPTIKIDTNILKLKPNLTSVFRARAFPKTLVEDCCICFERLNTNDYQCDGCRNFLHDNCVTRWFERNDTCPLCRIEI